jgi:hypothetical protein
MAVFAEIVDGVVANVAVAASAAELSGTWVQIDALTPQPGIGWSYNGTAFSDPPAPWPTSPVAG